MNPAERKLRAHIRKQIRENLLKEEVLPDIKTVGDLKKLIKKTKIDRLKTSAKKKGISAIPELLAKFIPGVEYAKTVYDIFDAIYGKPNVSKVLPGLKGLKVDEKISAIVDDEIEAAFMHDLEKDVQELGDDVPLTDLDTTDMLVKYVKKHFDRTIKGDADEKKSVGEGMKITISKLRQIIRETIEEVEGDKDGDGDADFADVMYSRMKAGGLSKDKALKKSRKHDK